MGDDTGEFAARVRINREGCAHALADYADIGLVDADFDLHVAQIFGDGEQRRIGVSARGGCLALFNRAFDNDAVHGGSHRCIRQFDPCRRQGSFPLLHPGGCGHHTGLGNFQGRPATVQGCRLGHQIGIDLIKGRLRLLKLCPRLFQRDVGNDFALKQFKLALPVPLGGFQRNLSVRNLGHRPLQRGFGITQIGAGALYRGAVRHQGGVGNGQIRFRLDQLDFKGFRIDPGQDLSLGDLGIVVDQNLDDLPRDLGGDFDGADRVHGAGGGDGTDDRAHLHGTHAVFRQPSFAARFQEEISNHRDDCHKSQKLP